MVDKKIDRYSEEIEKLTLQNKEENSTFVVNLFFSFDIVDSTKYKDANIVKWPEVLISLLEDLHNEVIKTIPDAELWRILGDEAVYFVEIKEIDQIYEIVASVYEILNRYVETIKMGGFLPAELRGKIENLDIIALQSTAWIAIIRRGETAEIRKYENVFKEYTILQDRKILEFLGQDIDIGFRLSKETEKRRLVLSLELAYILKAKTDYLSRLHIMTYRHLKGVMQEGLYPIIWYYDENISGQKFEESFCYDEITYSKVADEYFSYHKLADMEISNERIPGFMYTDICRALEKVIEDRRLKEKINRIYEIVNNSEKDERVFEDAFDDKKLELHCAAVCCDVDNRSVLIAKRRGDRSILPGIWEFGCAKASIQKDIAESIKEEYKGDFGIDIEVVLDKKRTDSEPVPLAIYQVEKVNKKTKGYYSCSESIGHR